jgi:hypothetical protein
VNRGTGLCGRGPVGDFGRQPAANCPFEIC